MTAFEASLVVARSAIDVEIGTDVSEVEDESGVAGSRLPVILVL